MQAKPSEIARQFCLALDQGHWEAVSSLLDPGCRYHFRGGTTTGVETIVGSYRKIDEWVREVFDSVAYESHVEMVGDAAALITFRDQISCGQHHLDFRCQQRIDINERGRIDVITHIDIEGEREKADRFNKACGAVKPR